MAMYCGIDLHSNNNYVAILDGDLGDVACRRLHNDLEQLKKFLEPHRDELVAVAVESTYNWYWLADGLKKAGYDMRLVNTTKASDYSKLKYTDDRHDARWIARLLALGILPEGYIVPPEERGVRDLLRRRAFFVQKRTAHLLSLRTYFERSTGRQVPSDEIQTWDSETVHKLIDDRFVAESIAMVLPVVRLFTAQIKAIEKIALAEGKLRDEFQLLRTAPGIGVVLGLTIMCETSDIKRFPKVGNYSSYCRCVKSEFKSNYKKKGVGNRKNGNKYLSWAYAEAAHHAVRYEPRAKRYHARKSARSHPMVAWRALSNKLARGCYFVLRDQVPFDPTRAFS